MSSIFTAESGEWKLAGFEVLSSMKDDDPVIYVRTSLRLYSYRNYGLRILMRYRNLVACCQTREDMLRQKL